MVDINDIITGRDKLNNSPDFKLLDEVDWKNLDYNDAIIIEKNNGIMSKGYFKSMNDNYVMYGNLKYKSNNIKFKYTPFRFLKTNIANIYRRSKLTSNIELMELSNRVSALEDDIVTLKRKINKLIKIINGSNASN